MPPSSPIRGLPRVRIVFAQLIIRAKLVVSDPLLFASAMESRCAIVWQRNAQIDKIGYLPTYSFSFRLLPRQTTSKLADHAITKLGHVPLPKSALLGAMNMTKDMRKWFLSSIWRIWVGTLAFLLHMIPAMKRGVFVAGKYSDIY